MADDVLAFPIDHPLQQVVNVHWGGYWVHVTASNNSLDGDMGVVIRKKGGKVLAASSYQQSGGGGITTTTWYLWMPVDYSLNFGEDFGGGDDPGTERKAKFVDDQFFSGDPLELRIHHYFHRAAGYLTLEDALEGTKAPDTSSLFNYLNEDASPPHPWITPDAMSFATAAEAEAKKAELEALVLLPDRGASTSANLWASFGQYRVNPPGFSPPISDPNPGAWKQSYLITSRESTTDPQGFQTHNALLQVGNSSDDEDVVFDVILQGGIDSFDDPSWSLEIDVFSRTSGTRDGDGKLIKHTIVASSMGSFLIDPADDVLWSISVDTPGGNPFGLAAGTYSFVLRKRSWNDADPLGVGGTGVNDADGDPIPGKIIECFLTAPADYQWGPPLVAFTAEKSHNGTYPNLDYHNSNQPFPAGPPPLATLIP